MKNEWMEAKDVLSGATNSGRHSAYFKPVMLQRVQAAAASFQIHVQMIYITYSEADLLVLRLLAMLRGTWVHANPQEPRIR